VRTVKSVFHGAENHCETKRANYNYSEETKKKQTYVLSFNFFAVISLLVSFRCKLNLNQFEKIRETDHQTCSSVA